LVAHQIPPYHYLPQGLWHTLVPRGTQNLSLQGGYYGNVKILFWVFSGLFQFITDSTGLFLGILLTLDQGTKKGVKPSFLEKTRKTRPIYYGYYKILRILWNFTDITEMAISEYSGISMSVISHPPCSLSFINETATIIQV
jgi:hypothetical protein